MEVTVYPGKVAGSVRIPGSKSHTIRALVLATLAEGRSRIGRPLYSEDTKACLEACRAFGGVITESGGDWIVSGTGGKLNPPPDVIDVANSGTTLLILLGAASLFPGWSVFTGDEQIRRRPVGPLVNALNDLGAEAFTTRENGCPPVVLRGPLSGGSTRIACPTSQYLTSLLISCPLARGDSDIEVTELNERPYVEMTLDWLDRAGIEYTRSGWRRFRIRGNQRYPAFERDIPGDYSSATFFLCAAAVTGSRLTLAGLDRNDCQGDREVLTILERMGCSIEEEADGITITGKPLRGGSFDLNNIPDALPALAVTACFAEGVTELRNVPQARLKETDRIAVMREELSKMGADIQERPDGLLIRNSALKGGKVAGHSDHRVVMALAVAGLGAGGPVTIETAETAAVTFPEFFPTLQGIREA